jgi:hypothetical protein
VTTAALHKQRHGGDADVVIPLLLSTLGATSGAEALPLYLVEPLTTHDLIVERAAALTGDGPPALRPLTEEELRISRGVPVTPPAPSDVEPSRSRSADAPDRPRSKEQLRLL